MKIIDDLSDELCCNCAGIIYDTPVEELLYKLSKALTTTTEYTKYWSGNWYITKCPVCNKQVYGTGAKPEHTSECALKIAEEIVKEYEEDNK